MTYTAPVVFFGAPALRASLVLSGDLSEAAEQARQTLRRGDPSVPGRLAVTGTPAADLPASRLVARFGELSIDDVARLDAAGGTAVFVRRRTDAGRGGEPVFVPQLGDAEFTAQRFAQLGAVNLGFGGYLLVADEGAELGADGFPTAGAPFSLFLVFMGSLYRVTGMTPVPVDGALTATASDRRGINRAA